MAAKKTARKVIVALPTFREAAQKAHGEQQAGWRNPKHRAQWLSSLEAYAFPSLGGETVDKIDRPMIRDTLLPIWLGKPKTARRVRQCIGAVLDWAYAKGHRTAAQTIWRNGGASWMLGLRLPAHQGLTE